MGQRSQKSHRTQGSNPIGAWDGVGMIQTPPNSRKKPQTQPRTDRVWILAGICSQNFSTRDVTAAMAPAPSRPRFQGIWGHKIPTAPAWNSTFPKAANPGESDPKSSSIPTPPGPIRAGAGIGSRTKCKKKSPGASSSNSSPQEYPKKIPKTSPVPPHRC